MNKTQIAILSMLLILVVACAPAPETSEAEPSDSEDSAAEKIVMGAMLPLTGDAAAYGEPLSRQLMLAVDEINEAGGIDGAMIEIRLEDSKCTPKDGANAANKLINVDGVKVIFGGACSGETLGAAPIAEEAGVLIISPSATSPDVTTAGDYVFRTAPSDAFAAKVAADKAIEMGFTKAATIHETTDYAQGLQKVFVESFEAGGGKVVVKESFSSEDSDFKTQVLKIKDAEPDVIYVAPQTPAKGILVVKQIKEQGLEQQLFTAELLIGRDVAKENAELESIIGVEADFDDQGGIASEVLAAYAEEHGDAPWPFYQSAMRDAVYVVADAIGEHGYDADAIKNALYATKDWEGAVGMLTFDANGDPVLSFRTMKVAQGEVIELN